MLSARDIAALPSIGMPPQVQISFCSFRSEQRQQRRLRLIDGHIQILRVQNKQRPFLWEQQLYCTASAVRPYGFRDLPAGRCFCLLILRKNSENGGITLADNSEQLRKQGIERFKPFWLPIVFFACSIVRRTALRYLRRNDIKQPIGGIKECVCFVLHRSLPNQKELRGDSSFAIVIRLRFSASFWQPAGKTGTRHVPADREQRPVS